MAKSPPDPPPTAAFTNTMASNAPPPPADAAATLAVAPPAVHKMSSMDAFVRNMLLEVADGELRGRGGGGRMRLLRRATLCSHPTPHPLH